MISYKPGLPKVSPYQLCVKLCEGRMLQGNAGLLLQGLVCLCVVVLPKVLQTQTDGLSLSILTTQHAHYDQITEHVIHSSTPFSFKGTSKD